MSCGICGEQNYTMACFLRVRRFPLPIIPPTASHSSPCADVEQIMAAVQNGLSLTPPQETKEKLTTVKQNRQLRSIPKSGVGKIGANAKKTQMFIFSM
jgi:hypothetical protein